LANINELGLIDEPVEVDPTDLPDPVGGVRNLPQPGTYRFRLPATVSESYSTVQTVERGQRILADFSGEHSLIMVPSGQPFSARISNVERKIKDKLTSDMASLLVQAFGWKDPLPNSKAYIHALNEQAGKEFIADVEWQSNCSPKREIFKDSKVQKGVMGCGARFAMRSYPRKDGGEVYQIPKAAGGAWVDEFSCPKCGAIVRAFGQLARFQVAK
jgi:hypothetical protein